jgi:arylsulfatase A-like enzyme
MNPAQKALWDKYYGPENEAYEKNKPTGKDQVRWNYQRYIKDYLRCVAGVDDGVGRVLKYLDENGLAENTIVVYSSDQGFYLGDKGWFDKRWMYDVSMRMPFVVRWPGKIKAGTENHDLVQNLDFGPTFLDAAGIQVPADMQGKSIILFWRDIPLPIGGNRSITTITNIQPNTWFQDITVSAPRLTN